MVLTVNPFYKKLVPILSTEEYNSLRESIQLHGLWLPIIINKKNVILDGHHRYEICQESDIKVKTIIKTFSSDTDETIFVGESNLKRRQLTPLQKIKLVSQLEPYYIKLAQKKIRSGKKTDPVEMFPQGKTRDILGKKAGVSGKTYYKGTRILKNATTQDILEINAGKKSINSVYHNITKNEENHFRQDRKQPYSFSLHEKTIQSIQYYKRTIPQHNLDVQVEDFIVTIVPSISK